MAWSLRQLLHTLSTMYLLMFYAMRLCLWKQPICLSLLTISIHFMDMFSMVETNHSLAVEHSEQQAMECSHGKNPLHMDFSQQFANWFQLPWSVPMQRDIQIALELKPQIKHFNFDDESKSLYTEMTILGWAQSLLIYAYNFIHSTIQKQGEEPPMLIPSLWFVHAVLTYAQKSLDASGTSSSCQSSSHQAVYLMEELPPVDKKPFIKYIHNSDAVPNVQPQEEGYETA